MKNPYSIERDVESAYGSDISSNSNFVMKKERFSMDSSATKNNIWYRWLKQKTGEYMIFEGLLLITLVFIIINSYRFSSQNQETQAMILNLQSQFNSFQNRATEKQSSNVETYEADDFLKTNYNEIKYMLTEILKEVRTIPISRTETTQQPKVLEKVKNSDTIDAAPEISMPPTNATLTNVNVASLIAGATVDTDRSSASNMNPYIGYDQSSIVLVDRPEPPADKAWCTYEKDPVITVSIAKYVKPTSVSYQHSKWNGTIPNDTPKIYDVVACLDYYCEKWEPLVSNCKYIPYRREEQSCDIPSNAISSPIGKIQFRFRENQGNIEKTCVSLIRVYADIEQEQKSEVRSLEDTKQCLDLKNDYHKNYLTYNYLDMKSCKFLYSKGCCTDCPECCEKCDIQDIHKNSGLFLAFVMFSPFWVPIVLLLIWLICLTIYEILRRLYLLLRKTFIF